MCTGLSRYTEDQVKSCKHSLRYEFYALLQEEEFNTAITYGTNDTKRVKHRFLDTRIMFEEIFGAHAD